MKKAGLLIIILFSTLSLSSFAQGQLNDTIAIEEVVVTGSKVEVSRKLIPVSVSTISKQEIEHTGEINILPTLSTYAPGVFVTQRNVLGFGVSDGSAGAISIRGISGSPNTSVLVLINGHPQYQGIFGHPLPDAYVASDVEKVEIIRGPASILYGSNAMAGVINIITKQQKKDGIDANIEASYGSYNTQKYSGTLGYKKEKLSVFASINHDQTDGTRENTDFKITNGFAKIDYQINSHYLLTGDFNLASFNANDNGSIYEAPKPFNIDIQRGKTSLSLENKHEHMDGALKIYHNFGTHDLSDDLPEDLSSNWYSTDRNSGIMFYQTMQWFEGNKITAGIDAKQYGGKSNSGAAKDSLITINELAFYTYVQQALSEQISLSAGIRLEHNSKYKTELIPMVGLNYNPNPNTTLKGSISKGFRSPTVMEMYLFAPNPNLKPERMINYEVSWLQGLVNNRLHTELTLFAAEGENIIQKFPNYTRENSGTFSNKGIEVAAKYKMTEQLFLHANYSYLNTEDPAFAAPEHQFNLSLNYSYKIFNLNVSTQHIEGLYTSLDPELQESYTLVNARLNAKLHHNVNLFVIANNLLNEKYEINKGYPMPKINFSTGVRIKL